MAVLRAALRLRAATAQPSRLPVDSGSTEGHGYAPRPTLAAALCLPDVVKPGAGTKPAMSRCLSGFGL
eukprot:11221532-Lingulodinium_polyedra.AAC.1